MAKSSTASAPSALVRGILECLDGSKAEDLVAIDLRGKSSLTDTIIIATGRSDRHVGAIADHLVKHLKEKGVKHLGIEGLPNCDWVLIDAGDVIIHMFRREERAFYRLERLWKEEAPNTDAQERVH
ncbi:MAG: ribosome silencing factor [Alphaproteobacteria bacterium]